MSAKLSPAETVVMIFDLPKPLKMAAKGAAKRDGVTLAEWVRVAISKALGRA